MGAVRLPLVFLAAASLGIEFGVSSSILRRGDITDAREVCRATDSTLSRYDRDFSVRRILALATNCAATVPITFLSLTRRFSTLRHIKHLPVEKSMRKLTQFLLVLCALAS